MLLVAALAIGMAISRFAIQFMWKELSAIPIPTLDTMAAWRRFLFGPNQLAFNATRFANMIFLNFLIWLMLAVIVIRLKRPRPTLAMLFRQPGFVACIAPALALMVCGLLSLTPLLPQVVYRVVLVAAAPISWLILIVTGFWQVEPGWIDRLGRVVGILFMASFCAHGALGLLIEGV